MFVSEALAHALKELEPHRVVVIEGQDEALDRLGRLVEQRHQRDGEGGSSPYGQRSKQPSGRRPRTR